MPLYKKVKKNLRLSKINRTFAIESNRNIAKTTF